MLKVTYSEPEQNSLDLSYLKYARYARYARYATLYEVFIWSKSIFAYLGINAILVLIGLVGAGLILVAQGGIEIATGLSVKDQDELLWLWWGIFIRISLYVLPGFTLSLTFYRLSFVVTIFWALLASLFVYLSMAVSGFIFFYILVLASFFLMLVHTLAVIGKANYDKLHTDIETEE